MPTTVGPGAAAQVESSTFCDDYGVGPEPNNEIIPIDDSRTFYVHVFPSGDSYSCTSYELTVDVSEEFFGGFCL